MVSNKSYLLIILERNMDLIVSQECIYEHEKFMTHGCIH